MRAPISLAISVVSITGSMRRWMAKISCSWLRSASTADCMSGYCSLQASSVLSWARARCTWPSEAAAAGWCSKLANFFCQSGPSSAAMRRLTKAQPMGGASLCSFISSAAYSGGSASGMVAKGWPTFMIGPLRPPSAAASSRAFFPRSRPSPTSPAPRLRPPTPPILAAARAERAAGAEKRLASRSVRGVLDGSCRDRWRLRRRPARWRRDVVLDPSCEAVGLARREREDHSGGGCGRHVKIDPVETEKHEDGCEDRSPAALDKGIGRTAPAGLPHRWNRLSRPLEEVFSRFHKRVIQDGALPLRCLWPHSDVIAA